MQKALNAKIQNIAVKQIILSGIYCAHDLIEINFSLLFFQVVIGKTDWIGTKSLLSFLHLKNLQKIIFSCLS